MGEKAFCQLTEDPLDLVETGEGPSTLRTQAEGGDCRLNLDHQQSSSWEITDFPISENIITQYALSSPHH